MDERHCQVLAAICAEWQGRPSVLAVLLHGSTAVGGETQLSDLDVRVWVEGDGEMEERRSFRNGVPVHLILYRDRWLDREIANENLLTLHMVIHDQILWEREQAVTSRRERLAKYQPSPATFAGQTRTAKALLVKAAARLGERDYAAAALCGRLAALAAAEGLVIASGELRVKPQWLVKMLRGLSDQRTAELCLEALGVADVTRAEAEAVVGRGAALVATLERDAARSAAAASCAGRRDGTHPSTPPPSGESDT